MSINLRPVGITSSILLLAACGDAPSPAATCGADLPTTVAVVEGGRVLLARGDDLHGELLVDVRADDDLTVTLRDESIALRVPLGVGARTVTLVCADGETEVALDVQPLAFTPVLDWEADEEAGAPAGREYFAWWMSPLPDERALYFYGGFAYQPEQFTPRYDLYRFDLDGSAWSAVPQSGPLPHPGGRVATTPSGAVRYFGGGELADDGSLVTEATFLEWSRADGGEAAFTASTDADAPGSYTGSLFFDARRDRWLSVCGVDTQELGVNCAVHAVVDGGSWRSLDVAGEVPPGRFGFHFALDPENDRVVVYGGQGASAVLADTWVLDLSSEPPTWTSLPDAGGSPRRNGAYAYDPYGHRMLAWGGTGNGNTALPGLDVLPLDGGAEGWSHVALDVDGPPARASGQCLFDEAERRLLCGFGNAGAVYTDLWALALVP